MHAHLLHPPMHRSPVQVYAWKVVRMMSRSHLTDLAAFKVCV